MTLLTTNHPTTQYDTHVRAVAGNQTAARAGNERRNRALLDVPRHAAVDDEPGIDVAWRQMRTVEGGSGGELLRAPGTPTKASMV